jgi:F-type H+-transporting ATPase subunit c
MGIAIAKSSESIARQPEAKDSIRTSLLLGLIFIETVVIYALVIAIMIIFVL